MNEIDETPESLDLDNPSHCKVFIDQIVEGLQGPEGRAASRELSLAITNLQQARMWINEHQRLA